MNVLVDIMVDNEVDAKCRISAANHVLDRGWGKPTSHVDVVTTKGDTASLSDDELINIIKRGVSEGKLSESLIRDKLTKETSDVVIDADFDEVSTTEDK